MGVREMKQRYRNRVLQARLEAGIETQKELARLSGIASSVLCDIESNRLFLSSPYALRLNEVLGCGLDQLFEKRA